MPPLEQCLLMQGHVDVVSVERTVRRYINKLIRRSKYYRVVLTYNSMLCCSKKNAGTIYFTVNLKTDDYHYEEGEDEDKMYIPDRKEWLHFGLSTSEFLRNTIGECIGIQS
jgi:hypothetical protein